eukprot:CAMPEP_0180154298 /NCGR_PEP_ID=MMETSP0986-20121125/24082_1 /TAXON_ID=697907 /ORGANISM="non described non described, Strain CCMP2293" /LENGTH=180 /DNA_ID=CAMNT_0022102639 /DNA_START=226 /DNA_END=771 /DNA_ORIENTATION=-
MSEEASLYDEGVDLVVPALRTVAMLVARPIEKVPVFPVAVLAFALVHGPPIAPALPLGLLTVPPIVVVEHRPGAVFEIRPGKRIVGELAAMDLAHLSALARRAYAPVGAHAPFHVPLACVELLLLRVGVVGVAVRGARVEDHVLLRTGACSVFPRPKARSVCTAAKRRVFSVHGREQARD